SAVYAQVIDAAGNISACSTPIAYVHDDAPPSSIILSGTTPVSPSSEPNPTVNGDASPGVTIRLYLSGDCSGAVVAETTTNANGTFTQAVGVTLNSSSIISANATDEAGNVSFCAAPLTYLHDDIAPAPPVLSATQPTSPGATTKPTISGTAENNSSVVIFADAACSQAVGSGTANGNGAWNITLTTDLPADTTTALFANASDAAGNTSTCAGGLSYTNDSTAPAPPVLLSTAPESPSSERRPIVFGTAEPNTTITFHLNASCSNTIASNGSTDEFGDFDIKLIAKLPKNQTSTIYATATDASGNISNCSSTFLVYVHDATAPTSPLLTKTEPGSPSNATTTPVVFGQASPDVPLVRIYLGQGCNTEAAVVVPDADGSFSVPVTVPANTQSFFTAKAFDDANNGSLCSTPPLEYIHDSIPPSFPGSYTGPELSLADKTTVQVQWPAASDNFTPKAAIVYELCVSTICGDTCDPWAPAVTTSGGDVSYTLNDLEPNTRYYIMVRGRDLATNLDTNSLVSSIQTPGTNIASAITLGGARSCAVVADGTLQCFGGTEIPQNMTQVSFGTSHYCGVRNNGKVSCAGDNANGQLGNGTTISSANPVDVVLDTGGILNQVASVSVGDGHSCALTVAGSVYCWGYNEHGSVGLAGDAPQQTTAVPVLLEDGTPLTGGIDLVSGSEHNCVLQADGAALCWGFNWAGQLGNGLPGVYFEPVAVDLSVADGFLELALGTDHSCGVGVDGRVYCWGFNATGQLGLGPNAFEIVTKPTWNGLEDARAIGASGSHSCAVLADSTVRCWGNNESGQLGAGFAGDSSPSPLVVSGLTDAVDLDAGSAHACALTSGGQMFCWGQNSGGQLGDGTNQNASVPVSVDELEGFSYVTDLDRFSDHACARLSDSTVRCWGRNANGQTGEPASPATSEVVIVAGLPPVVEVATGGAHSCAILSEGALRCWGQNTFGQLGAGTINAGTHIPQTVNLNGFARGVAMGQAHTCGVRTDGSVYCWGNNVRGQLGLGNQTATAVPSAVNVGGAVKVVAGDEHTCVVVSGGNNEVRCWGAGDQGQLGAANTNDSAVPQLVSGLDKPLKDIAAGADHTCVVFSDGTVACWGDNSAGQLGDGTNDDSAIPTAISGLDQVLSLSGGADHTCALRADDTVRCWGANDLGALGTSNTISATTPQTLIGASNMASLALGNKNSCLLRYDGTVDCWGDNSGQRLQVGPDAFYTTPQQVQCLP
ncbi:MAG: Ig-like domain-containing protein, partial [Myxococcota bacterium]|nr:Ig-like domain-containing protein [Myxococcota bacterium]